MKQNHSIISDLFVLCLASFASFRLIVGGGEIAKVSIPASEFSSMEFKASTVYPGTEEFRESCLDQIFQ